MPSRQKLRTRQNFVASTEELLNGTVSAICEDSQLLCQTFKQLLVNKTTELRENLEDIWTDFCNRLSNISSC